MRRFCTVRLSGFAEEKKFTFLSGVICLPCGSIVMSKIRSRVNRLTKDPAHPFAVYGYESLNREAQNRQRLMMNPEAPCMATCRESKQKSAEGIVLPGNRKEGPNAGMRGGLQ